jgi:D-amino-acid dehydrogenase
VVAATGIEFNRLEKGIAHYFVDPKSFSSAAKSAAMMAKYGVNRRVVSKEELLKIEPAFQQFAAHIVGGTYTASDESGDARVFTQELAKRCAAKGVKFLWSHDVLALNQHASTNGRGADKTIDTVSVSDQISGRAQTLTADHFVVAMGSYTAPLLRTVGVNLPIYPGKGYSATFKILKPELAPKVSFIDDSVKCAMSRLGDELRIAGTIEVGGYSLDLDGSLARARCAMLARRVETVFPGVCDTRTEAEGGNPRFWTGLRPATPTNIPYIGKTKVGKLWVNAGHGTLGWTHGAGSGKALAELMSGQRPAMQFGFYGLEKPSPAWASLKHD